MASSRRSTTGTTAAPRRRGLLVALLVPPVLAACASEESGPVIAFGAPPTYTHLTPLRLNVGAIELDDRLPGGAASLVMGPAPVAPAAAMLTMARDRLVAAGSGGVAQFHIVEASLVRTELAGGMFARGGERLVCTLRCRLDLIASDGQQAGFVEAQARRVLTAPGQTDPARRSAAADRVVRAAMDDLNVELEFQIRRNLRDWLLVSLPPGVAPPPPPVAPPGAGGSGAPEEVMREDLPRD